MFYGHNDQYQLFWLVRGTGNSLLPATGQLHCFDNKGKRINCSGTGQDGYFQRGQPWPKPRFTDSPDFICDNLTGLGWAAQSDISREPISWEQALELIFDINRTEPDERHHWRLPNINELTSLVDCSAHSPTLPVGHPFTALRDGYWSSTTSFFETDWAWVLYLNKGACGVGHKPGKTFYVWPVTTLNTLLRSQRQYIQFSKN